MPNRTINSNPQGICVVGAGYVGLPLAVAFGRYRKVIAFDTNSQRISELNELNDTTLECTRDELASATHLSFTNNINDVIDCSIYIVTVPTPVDRAKNPNFRPLLDASMMIASILKPGDTVIYESTVYPGATEEKCVPILEQYSGLKYNLDFYCGYSPERINPGDKVHGLPSIVKITSGSTPEVASKIDSLYREIITAGTFKASSIRIAEAAKIIENTQRDLNIAFFNELSLIFQRLEIDTDEVIKAASSKWNFLPFKPGLVGGHCIGVDPYYLAYKAEEVGYHPELLLAGRRINDNMPTLTANRIVKKMLASGIDVASSTIGFLGLTFKDNCPDIRNSKSIELFSELRSWGADVIAFDPWADPELLQSEHGIVLHELNSSTSVDVLVVSVGHSEYTSLGLDFLKSLYRHPSLILADLKSIYPLDDCLSHGFKVIRL